MLPFTRLILFVILVSSLVLPVWANEIVFERHSNVHPRVLAPCINLAPNGSLFGIWSYRQTFDSNDLGIWSRHSEDGGRTWVDTRQILKGEDSLAVCLLTLGMKMVLFFDKIMNLTSTDSVTNSSVWIVESLDNGQTWENERQIDGGLHNYVLGTYSATIMRNGTVIYPISWSAAILGSGEDYWACAVLRSDDNCSTWYQGEEIPNNGLSTNGLDEPVIVELSNRSIFCVMRSLNAEHPNHVSALSDDYGITWTNIQWMQNVTAINTTPAMQRVSWTPNMIVLAWINRPYIWWNRRPLVLSYSTDDCNTWHNLTVVDEAPGFYAQVVDMSFCVLNEHKILLGYRRYNVVYPYDDDAIIRRLIWATADFDRDGTVTSLDATFLVNHMNMINHMADLNGDGITDIYDAILLSMQFRKGGWICDY